MIFNNDGSVKEINKEDVITALNTMENLNFNLHIGEVQIDPNDYLESITLCQLLLTSIIQDNLFDVFPFIKSTSPDNADN